MANPTASFTGTVKGVWLMPRNGVGVVADARAWIGGPSPDTDVEVSSAVYTVPGRRAKISSRGTVHLDEGVISGALFDFNGLTGDQWLTRLQDLVRNQHLYVVRLTSSRYDFPVELGNFSKSPAQMGAGRAWRIDVDFREVS
jgi:hypothetical protein